MSEARFSIRPATWLGDEAALRSIRFPVFVVEQKIDEREEFDEVDAICRHFLAADKNSKPIGTCRVDRSGKIGRVAVLKEWRGSGVGRALLRYAIESARADGVKEVYLHAQVIAAPFYERDGFVSYGEQFMESAIQHIAMKREL